ncbi:MAG TPA: hypothetical protein VLC49_14180 [Solirubrobacteraceae bacterium]|nr:hypothetical protein [Solirubrobacteraceae bacterium]
MNNQHDYLVVKVHIDDLMRAAERARMARSARPWTPARPGRDLVGRLRRRSRRSSAVTVSEVCADCP